MENNIENNNVDEIKVKKGFSGKILYPIGNYYKNLYKTKGMKQVLTVIGGLIVLIIVFWAINPRFLSAGQVRTMVRDVGPFLLVGIGQAFVLITGNIDLSIGSVLAMGYMIIAILIQSGVPWFIAIPITLICCLIIGVINGQLVARFKLPPFIATLGTMFFARGIAWIFTEGRPTGPIGLGVEHPFRQIFWWGDVLGISFVLIIALVVWFIFNFMLSRARIGRHIYAVGSNREAAKLSGVNTISTITKAYMVSAFCAALVGIMFCAQTGSGSPTSGQSYEMFGVAVSVIGGVSTLGGQGLLLGTIVGAALWVVLESGLVAVSLGESYKLMVIGIVVVVAVLLDIILRKGIKRKKKTVKAEEVQKDKKEN